MPQPQTLEKPTRWDLPFSQDFPNEGERCNMSDEDISMLLAREPFNHMQEDNFPKTLPLRGILENDTRIRHYHPGDVVVRQGDYGNSAFLIIEGTVTVALEGLSDKNLGRAETKEKSLLESFMNLITNPKAPEVRDSSKYHVGRQKERSSTSQNTERIFVQDVTNILSTSADVFEKTKNIQMDEGQLFGELAALGRIPRATTVVAAKDTGCTLLEIRWQGLRELRKYDEELKNHVDEQFRKYGLEAMFIASPLLSTLSEEEVQEVAKEAEFETYGSFDWYGSYQQLMKKDQDPLSKEPIICQEDHYPNGLYIIRSGFARLSKKKGNGEHTYSYLGKGDVYGLAETVYNHLHPDDPTPQIATLRAIGYVDVVFIPTHIVEKYILPKVDDQKIPGWNTLLRRLEEEKEMESHSLGEALATAEKIDPALVEFLVEHRYINGSATMMIDLDRCTRCDDCVRACASGHSNNPRFIRHGHTFGQYLVANACMHCNDPVCMIGCPTGAIHRSEQAGEVSINDTTCIGCGTCASSCPYSNIRLVNVRDEKSPDNVLVDPNQGKPIVKATKCDLCVDHHGGPACERACPHDALKRVNMRDTEDFARYLNR